MAVGQYIGDNNPDGMSFGKATTEKISFYGVTPVAQQSGAAQAAVTTTAITTVTTTAATSTSPVGYSANAQADAIPVAINALITRVALNTALVNELRQDLVDLGLIAGA